MNKTVENKAVGAKGLDSNVFILASTIDLSERYSNKIFRLEMLLIYIKIHLSHSLIF